MIFRINKNIQSKKLGFSLIFVVFGLPALIFPPITFYLVSKQFAFIRESIPERGTVTALAKKTDSDNNTLYAPIIEYVDIQGETQTFTSAVSSNPPAHRVGEVVNILIPKNGEAPQVNSFLSLWFMPVIFGFLSVVLWFVLFFVARAVRIYRRNQALLAKEGVVIQATVLSTDRFRHRRRSSTSWYVTAQWQNPNGGKVYVFNSDSMSYDPKQFLKETISVKIAPSDPTVYEVDLSGLPA